MISWSILYSSRAESVWGRLSSTASVLWNDGLSTMEISLLSDFLPLKCLQILGNDGSSLVD